MHLLASQPGGYVDDEGIVDLQQSPAELVILSAADSSLAALAAALVELPDDFPSVRLANWLQLQKPAALDLYGAAVLEQARVVVVSLLGGKSYWTYGLEQLQAWQQQTPAGQPQRHLIVVPGDDSADPELLAASSVTAALATRVWQYLRAGGAANSRQLLLCLGDQLLGYQLLPGSQLPGSQFPGSQLQDGPVPAFWCEPQPLPPALILAPPPGAASGATLAQWQARWQDLQLPTAATPALLLFYRSHWQSANTAMFTELVQVLEAAGVATLPLAVVSLKDPAALALINHLLAQSGAGLLLNTTGFASQAVAAPELASEPGRFHNRFCRPLPVLQLILSGSTRADWEGRSQGLRARDIAMQIALPEMDGRVITRAISFKSSAAYCARAQLPVVGYELHPERAAQVAQLARRYLNLAVKANADKRIALILANYPTRDGRIGNGVGLDTPASTLAILHALRDAGYPVSGIPADGAALIQTLLEAVTNNPATLAQLPCWQSLALADYRRWFATLPGAAQAAVLERWGEPEADPKCRSGRLMLAGIRLGECFVGIQPARGFNLDLNANYHDPDLVPPHSYLAFYAWLREVYGVDAMVHVGKHGNLEWLPGKGTALSGQCWPDIALGPLPHFYPFIVNDPGEGAQAKRRAQAVVIDHLMPPMTRAETYGELAALELLVDEYYQALGMDSAREAWLRAEILTQVRATHLLEELPGAAGADTDALLSELDTYLCDIKEAQIRHGLHRLGSLPDDAKLTDTLVALLRLPRGAAPHEQGILHALVADLELQEQGVAFDPFSADSRAWEGERPICLYLLAADDWRSAADTRERLELLAIEWVRFYVVEGQPFDDLAHNFPVTQALLEHARHRVLTALQQSAHNEIAALLGGLAGQFVEPGPSGAPTRGRLDALPTGRNFYSVDNRAIPSPAAWALGQKSAQVLVERHLQEHGDYPRQLGLSVWGTATMRTGGDDIAQAFALMGVKPVWAAGSQRVVDIEVIPTMLMDRPRVDVTLRVSGLFRDAFPNVMKLFDAAVVAIARLEEPGDGNTIRQHIRARVQALRAQGLDADSAFRQASYRVFGSKPGAYGAGLQGLIDERCWSDRGDLAEAYLNWGGYAYGKHDLTGNESHGDGVAARAAFSFRLSQLEAVVQNQDNREHDLLDSDDYYQFQGGMTNAVTHLSGRAPAVYHGDHANPAAPRIRTLKEELNRVVRARVLNPKWIAAMREHGYKGAFEMAASIDYLFAYDATTDLVDDYQYQQVADALVFDPANQAFLQAHNPSALEEMAERLLEACQRGLWSEPGAHAAALQNLLLDLDQQQETAQP